MASDGALSALALGRIVGRAGDLEAVDRALEGEDRLVTVTGPGGIGKSRLALEVARRHLEAEPPRAVAYVDCNEVTSATALVDAVAAASGVGDSAEERDAGGVERVGRALCERGAVLVVLDDVDRVAAEAASVLASWLGLAPEARFLVTSRARLHLPGEAVHEVGPLGLPGPTAEPSATEPGPAAEPSEAEQLFATCARRIRSGWQLDEAEAPFVAEIVRALEGIPLAIELAASRMAVMGPRALLHRLRSGGDLLRRSERGRPARHSTLAGTIEWSYQHLEPWEQAALAQCSVFRGGFTLEAAEAVVDLAAFPAAPSVVDVAQALRDKSLLHARQVSLLPGELRLGLYAPIREYAAGRLAASGGADAAEARHAAYFVGAGRQWGEVARPGDGVDRRLLLLVERDNLLAVAERVLGRGPVTAASAEPALKALLALWPVLLVQGPLGTYEKLMGPVLDISAKTGADPSLQADALAVRGSLRWHRGESREGLGDLVRALAIARKLGNRRLEGRVLVHLGKAFADRGEVDEARRHYESALEAHHELGEEVEAGRALARLGQLEARAGRPGEARRYYERALAIHGRHGDPLLEAQDLRLLGELLLDVGQREEAQSCLDSGLDLARRAGDRRGEAIVRGLLALLHHDAGDLRRARRSYEEVVELLAALGFRRLEGIFAGFLGILEREAGRWVEATTLLERAAELVGADDAGHQGLFLAHLAGLEADAGRPERAKARLEEAEALAARAEASPFAAAVALERAHLAPKGASTAARKAEAPAARSVHVRLALRCLRNAMDRGPDRGEQRPMEDALIVGGGALWFRPPGGDRVSLKQRRPLRLVLQRLVEERSAHPGRPLDWEDLLAAGWPRERVIPSAGAHRVRVAVSTLRKLGLKDVLVTVPEGYLLDPAVTAHALEEEDRAD